MNTRHERVGRRLWRVPFGHSIITPGGTSSEIAAKRLAQEVLPLGEAS